jgi:hypothetical protein
MPRSKKRARSKRDSSPPADAGSAAQPADDNDVSGGSYEVMAALRRITQSVQATTSGSDPDPDRMILGPFYSAKNGRLSPHSDESWQNPITVVVVQQTVNNTSHNNNVQVAGSSISNFTIGSTMSAPDQTSADPLLSRIAMIEAQLEQTQEQLKQTQESYRNWLQHTTGQRQIEWYIVGQSLKVFLKHTKAHPQRRLNIHALILYELFQARPNRLSSATPLAEQVRQLRIYLTDKKLNDYLRDYNSTWKETMTVLFPSARDEFKFSNQLGFVKSSSGSSAVPASQLVAPSSGSSPPDSQTIISVFQSQEDNSKKERNMHAHQVTGLQLKKTVDYYQSDECLRRLCENDKALTKEIADRKDIHEVAARKFGLMFFGRNMDFKEFDDEFLSHFSFHNPTSRSFAEHDSQADSYDSLNSDGISVGLSAGLPDIMEVESP